MKKSVVEFVQACVLCQKSRVTVKEETIPEYHVIESFEPFEEVSIDFMVKLPKDELGNQNVLVVVDNFTKYVELFATPDMEATTTARCLLQLFGRFGRIARIRSDKGPQFLGDVCSSLCALVGAEQIVTVGFRPEANGVVERLNSEVKRHLQVLVNERQLQNKWSVVLPFVQRIVNSTVHSSTGFAPAEILYGNMVQLNRELISGTPAKESIKKCPEYVKELKRAQELAISAAQKNTASVHDTRVSKSSSKSTEPVKGFKEDDLVVAFRHGGSKLDLKWKGPFKVVRKIHANIYECLDLRTKKVVQFDVSSLRKFVCPPGVDPVSVAGIDEGEYIVDSILQHRLQGTNKKSKTHYYFLVRFSDGGEEWIPYMEVKDLEAFSTYLHNHQDFARQLKLKL
jgi:hypothetical protein